MRLSAVLLVCSLAGVLGGAALIGTWALGLAIIADSVAVGAWALLRDDGHAAEPQVHGAPTLYDVLERARRSA
jgi:hypothetical protein